jgi:NADPH:quinone reductase-like Zn-dependent oxidoreductase
MQTEFRAIVQSEYGAPETVLRIAKRQLKSEELGADDVLVRVVARPIHPGDIQILSALPQGGPVEPIPEGTLRVPGLEGVGTILRLGTNPEVAKRFSEGQRVAFFPAMGSWAEYVVVRYNCQFRTRFSIDCGADAHKYDHRIRTHQSWSQFT